MITTNETSVVLAGATTEWVLDVLKNSVDAADMTHRERTIRLSREQLAHGLRHSGFDVKPMSLIEWGGWGVPNSYWSRASTSLAGVAWFTDRSGVRHVRIYADRVTAPKSSFGRKSAEAFHILHSDGSGREHDYVTAVYPETRLPETLLVKHEKGPKAKRWPALKVALYRAILADPLEPSHRAALADWYGEQGDMVSSSRCCDALLCLTVIQGA